MRVILFAFSILALASCTAGQNNTPTTPSSGSTSTTVSPTGPKYDIALQKSVPSPTFGSGKHTLTIYADFQCPACIVFSSQLWELFQGYADTGKATLTYKQFPLTTIHKNAYRDAIAALCAAEQGKYLDYKKTLYTLEKDKAGASVSDDDRIEIARANGLDVAAMTQCLKDNRYAKQVDDEILEGDKAGVNGTPTVLLDGKRLDIGQIFADVEKGKAFMERVLAE